MLESLRGQRGVRTRVLLSPAEEQAQSGFMCLQLGPDSGEGRVGGKRCAHSHAPCGCGLG